MSYFVLSDFFTTLNHNFLSYSPFSISLTPIGLTVVMHFCLTLALNDREICTYYLLLPDLPKIRSSPNLKYHLYRQKTLEQASNGMASDEETEESELDASELKKEELMDKDDKQIEALHTIKCHVIAPGVVVEGTLAIATSYLYFTADDESLALQRIDPAVSAFSLLFFIYSVL